MKVNSPRFAGCPVNVSAALASVTATLIVGKSSLLIVPVPFAVVPRVALVGLVRFRLKVSLVSKLRSPITGTLTVWLVCPGVKVTVPLLAV